MGSGGMIVMDETDDLVELSRFYLGFCVDESCGKVRSVPDRWQRRCCGCSTGSRRGGAPRKISRRSDAGPGHAESFPLRLGQGAPNPVLSALRYFEPEFRGRLVSHSN